MESEKVKFVFDYFSDFKPIGFFASHNRPLFHFWQKLASCILKIYKQNFLRLHLPYAWSKLPASR